MKIKLALLEKDKNYLTRFAAVLSSKYSDKFELYSFSDMDVAMATLDSARIDLLLAGEMFDIDVSKLPARCGFAYLSNSVDIESVRDQRAICKFQKVDLIYKQILSVYAEKAGSITGFRYGSEEGQIVAVCSAAGGVGSSTVAAACAVRWTSQGKKVLYLNLEKFGSAELVFEGEGKFTMSDIIYAVKGKKANLHMKLESCVRQSESGVNFFASEPLALDLMELTCDERIRLLSELRAMGGYDLIILDMDFDLDEDTLKILRQAHNVLMVGDGTAGSNLKTRRALQALTTMEANAEVPLMGRVSYLYNRVSSKSGQEVGVDGLRVLGGAPIYAKATTKQIIKELATLDVLDELFA